MNLSALHAQEKEVSAISLFKGEIGTSTAIRLLENGELKEHVSKTPALLLCISGHVTYKEEANTAIVLLPGDYVSIPPNVKHKLEASSTSHLVLLK